MGQATFSTTPQPNLDDLAIDAVLHLGAALEVLELHARHKVTAINCVCRDLLRIYCAWTWCARWPQAMSAPAARSCRASPNPP